MLSALGPLFYAQKFVLVGDPQQLPPLVQSRAAKNKGMDVSLFSHLATKPENIIPLTMQYRMNEKIQALANHLTYEGRLECGSEDVAKRTLGCIKRTSDNTEPQWVTHLLDGTLTENSILFLNTDNLDNAMETTCDLGLYNPGEADIVQGICNLLQTSIVSDEYHTDDTTLKDKNKNNKVTIGVIAPYRAQVMHLRGKLASTNNTNIDVNTVDQFQGQDKDIIIYSCTRSTPRKLHKSDEVGNLDEEFKGRGDIMCDKRRLNVAITRAKSKLVILGNERALQSYEPFQKLITFLQEDKKVFQIYPNNLDYFKI
jgi:DNA replication ATP-dependent helicase Dna2